MNKQVSPEELLAEFLAKSYPHFKRVADFSDRIIQNPYFFWPMMILNAFAVISISLAFLLSVILELIGIFRIFA